MILADMSGIGRTKTLVKKAKNIGLKKLATNEVHVSPSQFVLETQGVMANCYHFVKQLGQGIYNFNFIYKRCIWNCL